MTNILIFNAILAFDNVYNIESYNRKNKNILIVKCDNHKRIQVFEKIIQLLKLYSMFPSIHHSHKSSIGIIETDNFEIIIKPVHFNHKNNEEKIIELYNEFKPQNIIFKSDNNIKKFNDVKKVYFRKVSNTRNNFKVNKEDVCIQTGKNKNHSISIKMTGGSTFWESADSLLNKNTVEIIKHICDKFNIKNFDGRKLTRDIIIDNHNFNLVDCVYGKDIKTSDGAVIVTNFNEYIYDDTTKTLIIICDRVFMGNEVLHDEVFAPIAIISKCKNRNINSLNKHLYTKVCTKKRAKNAISVNNIKSKADIYDEFKNV